MTAKREIQVLVVDDDPALCELLRTTFELEGIRVLEAQHVIEAERILIGVRPDAIVLDIGLPDYDGTQFVARWRERRPDASEVPIVVVSGRSDRREIAGLLGAAYVCGKPFEIDELVDQVERAVLN